MQIFKNLSINIFSVFSGKPLTQIRKKIKCFSKLCFSCNTICAHVNVFSFREVMIKEIYHKIDVEFERQSQYHCSYISSSRKHSSF